MLLDIRKNFTLNSVTLVQGKDDAETPVRAITLGLTAEATVEEVAMLVAPGYDAESVSSLFWDDEGNLIISGTKAIESENNIQNLSAAFHIGVGDEPKYQCHAQKLDKFKFRPMMSQGMCEVTFNILIDGYTDEIYTDIHEAKAQKNLMNIHVVQNEPTDDYSDQSDIEDAHTGGSDE